MINQINCLFKSCLLLYIEMLMNFFLSSRLRNYLMHKLGGGGGGRRLWLINRLTTGAYIYIL